jgi:hypothetical protein
MPEAGCRPLRGSPQPSPQGGTLASCPAERSDTSWQFCYRPGIGGCYRPGTGGFGWRSSWHSPMPGLRRTA